MNPVCVRIISAAGRGPVLDGDGAHVEVLDPPHLRAAVAGEALRLAALYATDPAPAPAATSP